MVVGVYNGKFRLFNLRLFYNKHWFWLKIIGNTIREKFNKDIASIKDALTPVYDFFVKYIDILKQTGTLFVSVFNGIVDVAIGAGAIIIDALLSPIESILVALAKIPGLGNKIKGFQVSIAGAREFMQEKRQQQIQLVSTQIQTAKTITENIQKSQAELFITDNTGKAELKTDEKNQDNFIMQSTIEPNFSGGF